MRVLHLISSGGMYGAENVIAALARDLQDMGHFVKVGVFSNGHRPENEVINQFRERGLEVVSIPCRGRVDFSTVRAICKISGDMGAQIVHCHGYKADIYGYLACRRLGIRTIATCHLWTGATAAVRVYDFLDALFLRCFDRVVAVSAAIAEEARRRGIPEAKVTTIDNGVDLSRLALAAPTLRHEIGQDDRILVGAIGRLVTQKGFDYFLRAAAEIVKQFPSALFVVVGDGPERASLEQLATELGVDKNVVFTGSRKDMPGVYASLDIFVLSSRDEGMPIVLLEAMASGRPVVATDVGAVSKLVLPGNTTGLLVRPNDTRELTDAIMSLLRAPDLRERLGKHGQDLVQTRFSSRTMTNEYARVYKMLLDPQTPVLNPARLPTP